MLRWLIPLAFLAFLRYWKASDLLAHQQEDVRGSLSGAADGATDDIDFPVVFDTEEPGIATFDGPPEDGERLDLVLQEEEEDNATEVLKTQTPKLSFLISPICRA